MNLTEQNLKTIKETFKILPYNPKPIKPCRVKFMGEFVTTESNKTIWKRKGDAKSAIILHFCNQKSIFGSFLPSHKFSNSDYTYIKDDTIKELIQYLEREKILEYIEVDAAEFQK
jgi:hypothetical protein